MLIILDKIRKNVGEGESRRSGAQQRNSDLRTVVTRCGSNLSTKAGGADAEELVAEGTTKINRESPGGQGGKLSRIASELKGPPPPSHTPWLPAWLPVISRSTKRCLKSCSRHRTDCTGREFKRGDRAA